jgi:hypothetical protein
MSLDRDPPNGCHHPHASQLEGRPRLPARARAPKQTRRPPARGGAVQQGQAARPPRRARHAPRPRRRARPPHRRRPPRLASSRPAASATSTMCRSGATATAGRAHPKNTPSATPTTPPAATDRPPTATTTTPSSASAARPRPKSAPSAVKKREAARSHAPNAAPPATTRDGAGTDHNNRHSRSQSRRALLGCRSSNKQRHFSILLCTRAGEHQYEAIQYEASLRPSRIDRSACFCPTLCWAPIRRGAQLSFSISIGNRPAASSARQCSASAGSSVCTNLPLTMPSADWSRRGGDQLPIVSWFPPGCNWKKR